MRKKLVVSGCSFTYEDWCWPTYLSNELDMDLINVAMGCQGNELIAKKLIYKLDKLLEIHKPEDLFVGIMWSGISRHSLYIDDDMMLPTNNEDDWHENPTSVTDNEEDKKWVILNWNWRTRLAKEWYGRFYNDMESTSRTLEYILMVQNYLEKNNINYFMTTYMYIFDQSTLNLCKSDELNYIWKQINFDKFLPIKGEYEWLIENYPQGMGEPDPVFEYGSHPTEEGHRYFVSNCMFPIIKGKDYISKI